MMINKSRCPSTFCLLFYPVTTSFRLKTTTITDLVAGTLYYMAVSSVYMDGSNEFKLGFESIASGLVVNPITKQYLTWKAPSKLLSQIL